MNRRRFLLLSAATGLAAAARPTFAASTSAPDIESLEILHAGWPRAFFFRHSEIAPPLPGFDFNAWDANYSKLLGIMGKTLDEEILGRSGGIPAFTRFKQKHPEQVVLLHFNGHAADPRNPDWPVYAGHWLYFNGAHLTAPVAATSGETEIAVADSSLFSAGIAGDSDHKPNDVGLCMLDAAGHPDWSRSEQVQVIAVDHARKSIRVSRAMYGSKPMAFPAGAYAAAHCSEPGLAGKGDDLLWMYNYATTCPKDADGLRLHQALARRLAPLFLPGGKMAAYDGLEFDVLMQETNATRPGNANRPPMGADANADGILDEGWIGGRNVYGDGVIAFCDELRRLLGDHRIIQADGFSGPNQRCFFSLNGIESEGWPRGLAEPVTVPGWSSGVNRHLFWNVAARKPVFNYINHKFKKGETGIAFNRNRLVFAAGVCMDTAITFSHVPDGGSRSMAPVWDELVGGTLQRKGWLGQPVASTRRLAFDAPSILSGKLAEVVQSAQAAAAPSAKAVTFTPHDKSAPAWSFRIQGVQCTGPDLVIVFTARGVSADPRLVCVRMVAANSDPATPPEMARPWRLEDKDALTTFVHDRDYESSFYFKDVKPGTWDIEVAVERSEPLTISALSAHAAPDAMLREFEHGLAVVNPALSPYTFDLAKLQPGRSYRRIQGTAQQDTRVNDGSPVGDTLVIPPNDGLFLMKHS